MKKILALLCLLAPARVLGARAVMEGIPATGNVISITTATARVYFSTGNYLGGIASVGVATSSNVVVSSPTGSNLIVLYASGTIKAARFQGDGSGLTNVSAGAVYTSTCTEFISGATETQTSCRGCVAKSTISYTSNGKKIEISFTGSVAMSAINNFRMNFLMDGAHVGLLSPTAGMPDITGPGATYRSNANFEYTTAGVVGAAQHSFCLQVCVDGDTATLGPNSSVVQFCARDVD